MNWICIDIVLCYICKINFKDILIFSFRVCKVLVKKVIRGFKLVIIIWIIKILLNKIVYIVRKMNWRFLKIFDLNKIYFSWNLLCRIRKGWFVLIVKIWK